MTESRLNELTEQIIGGAITVHRALGPGLLESAYSRCLAHELSGRSLAIETQKPLALVYKGLDVECAYRMDIVVEHSVVVEVKAVESVDPVHLSQLLTYLRLSGLRVGLLINFNARRLVDGVSRVVNNL